MRPHVERVDAVGGVRIDHMGCTVVTHLVRGSNRVRVSNEGQG